MRSTINSPSAPALLGTAAMEAATSRSVKTAQEALVVKPVLVELLAQEETGAPGEKQELVAQAAPAASEERLRQTAAPQRSVS